MPSSPRWTGPTASQAAAEQAFSARATEKTTSERVARGAKPSTSETDKAVRRTSSIQLNLRVQSCKGLDAYGGLMHLAYGMSARAYELVWLVEELIPKTGIV